MKNFKIQTSKTRKHVILTVVMVFVLLSMLVGCKKQNADSTENEAMAIDATIEFDEESESTPDEESEKIPSYTEEPDAEGDKHASESVSTLVSTEKSDGEVSSPTEASAHTHSYSSKVTQPTCTTGSHNYTNGTCTVCGATDTNYTHQHNWTETCTYEIEIVSACVDFYVCNDCGTQFFTGAELDAHQESTGWDGTCNSCGTYYYDGRTTFFVYKNNDPSTDRVVGYLCQNCGGTDFTRNSVSCGGWHNDYETFDYYEGIENDYHVAHYSGWIWEYRYKSCACGAREDYQPWTPRSGDFTYEEAFVLDPSTRWWEKN